MATEINKITTCLWFDTEAEDAANFYLSIFKNSKILQVTRYGKLAEEKFGKPEGSAMSVDFEIDGRVFTALNGGPMFKFNEATSFMVHCDTQQELDYYWEKLSEGGDPNAQQCGWIKDKFGLSWQIIPKGLDALVGDPNSEKSQKAFMAMIGMKKLDIEKLQEAYNS